VNRIILSVLFSVLTTLFFLQSASAQTSNASGQIEGQILCCEDCWNKADRRKVAYGSPEDLAQAEKCIANGDPTLLAVAAADGATKLYQLQDGKFKRPERKGRFSVRVVLWGVSGRAYAPRGEDFRDIPHARTGNRPTFNAISSAQYLLIVLRMLVRLQRQA
jgi:hypothetical protein